jgi:transmembrane sensor
MSQLEEEDAIEMAAADWLAEREEGLSAERLREFDRWRRSDPRHAAAVARLEAACALLEKMPLVREELLPVVEFPVEARAKRPATAAGRRGAWLGVAAGFVAVLLIIGGWRWMRTGHEETRYATTAGGYERVVLSDGSVVELNANTELRVHLTPRQRQVMLVAGEAHFTVAHDRARPFVVAADGVSVRAVGTAFNVRRASTAVEVLVTEGRVAVTTTEAASTVQSRGAADEAGATTRTPAALVNLVTEVAANERVSVSIATTPRVGPALAPTVVEKVVPDVVRETLSWQERKLVFAETPLREVVAQFNRRNRMQLVIGDAALAERPVGGTFAADNVEGFIRLLEGSGAIAVERRGDALAILHQAR